MIRVLIFLLLTSVAQAASGVGSAGANAALAYHNRAKIQTSGTGGLTPAGLQEVGGFMLQVADIVGLSSVYEVWFLRPGQTVDTSTTAYGAKGVLNATLLASTSWDALGLMTDANNEGLSLGSNGILPLNTPTFAFVVYQKNALAANTSLFLGAASLNYGAMQLQGGNSSHVRVSSSRSDQADWELVAWTSSPSVALRAMCYASGTSDASGWRLYVNGANVVPSYTGGGNWNTTLRSLYLLRQTGTQAGEEFRVPIIMYGSVDLTADQQLRLYNAYKATAGRNWSLP